MKNPLAQENKDYKCHKIKYKKCAKLCRMPCHGYWLVQILRNRSINELITLDLSLISKLFQHFKKKRKRRLTSSTQH